MAELKGIEMLTIKKDSFVIHPTLIWDEKQTLLIDTGMPGYMEDINLVMAKVNKSLEDLTGILLTHQDIDHIGSLPEILTACTQHLTIYAHKEDIPYIEGELPLIKANPANFNEKQWDALPDSLKFIYLHPPKAQVTNSVEDSQLVSINDGLEIIHTPGHTPGHISLFHKKSRTLVAGDALTAINGKLHLPNPVHTPDMDLAIHSIEKFLTYPIKQVVCYHGGIVTENVMEQLHGLVKSKTI
ncbi:MBL fold metallo-hydrolase [Niallia sp.]|uniref:MBL fold metallo-hydrolase n=1 Tax=Niallia sp. TaxID=2837523 RepID=UPI00289836FA|nr:MBL fold metallo-hydrolase [Niallia sp.]